jgi:ribA/ribD-fused uncharacterized protein
VSLPLPQERHRELLAQEQIGRLPSLILFWGHRPHGDAPGPWVLSQWWPSRFRIDGQEYSSAEQFLMAEKARAMGDEHSRRRILDTTSPQEAKSLGRAVHPFDEDRWAQARYGTAVRGNEAKFAQSPVLLEYLVGTGPIVLVEASPVDLIWGVGRAADDPAARRPSLWRGMNLLGFALMEVRELLCPQA